MKFLIPCLAGGLALLMSSCVAVDDPAVPEDPAPSVSVPGRSGVAPVRSASAPGRPEAVPIRPEAAPERPAPAPAPSDSDADTPGWLNGYQQGKQDVRRGLSPSPDRYDFMFSDADRAGFIRGYEAGYGRRIKN